MGGALTMSMSNVNLYSEHTSTAKIKNAFSNCPLDPACSRQLGQMPDVRGTETMTTGGTYPLTI